MHTDANDRFLVHKDPEGYPIKHWTRGVGIEPTALEQLRNVARLPFIYRHIAVMPDVHAGLGATIGSVVPTLGAVIPAAVGVDIGCGMRAVRTHLTRDQLPEHLLQLRTAIERSVPHGRTCNGGKGDRGRWSEIPSNVMQTWRHLEIRFEGICHAHPKILQSSNICHLGTLGTGNHFIEICVDQKDRVWVLLHSGSRGVGNRIGTYFIRIARDLMKKWFISLPDPDLAYIPEDTTQFEDYMEAVKWAQDYAEANRTLMMSATIAALAEVLGLSSVDFEDGIDCHHNYVAKEHHFGKNVLVTRKGAVRAREGDMGIIPGSMGERSFIVRGKGSPESFDSCSHGAGRLMSRTQARKQFTEEDLARYTSRVECRTDADVLDEHPHAYKDLDAVMAAQSDLVDVVHSLRQVVCVKG